MRFRVEGPDRREQRLMQWHRRFILWPICRRDGLVVWLEYMERKGTHHTDLARSWWQWEYRLPEEAPGWTGS